MAGFNNNIYYLTGTISDMSVGANATASGCRFVIPNDGGGVVVSRHIVLDGTFTTTAYVTNTKRNGTTISNNSLTILVADSAANATFGGDLGGPFEVKAGDCVHVNCAQAAGSAQSARVTIGIRR